MPALPIECDVHSIGEMIIRFDLECRNVIIPRQALANNVWIFGAICRWTLEFRLIENNDYSIDSSVSFAES